MKLRPGQPQPNEATEASQEDRRFEGTRGGAAVFRQGGLYFKGTVQRAA